MIVRDWGTALRRTTSESTGRAGSNPAVGVSLWDNRKNAEAYQTSTYPKILAKLNPVIVGTPTVKTYDVTATTLHA